VFSDIIRAVQLWPVWLRLGIQDVRLRFRRSLLGVAWIFLNLTITILTIGFIYSSLLGQDLKKFLPFLTIGLVVWGYLTAAVVEGGMAFITAEGYIRQIGVPIYVYIFRSFVHVSLFMLLNLVTYFPVAYVSGITLHYGMLWAVPGLLLTATVVLLFITMFAYLHTRFRDAIPFASALLQVVFYVTPVIWPPESLHQQGLHWVIDYNPFYHLLEIIRRPLLQAEPAVALSYWMVGGLIGCLTVMAGSCVWRYHQRIVYFL